MRAHNSARSYISLFLSASFSWTAFLLKTCPQTNDSLETVIRYSHYFIKQIFIEGWVYSRSYVKHLGDKGRTSLRNLQSHATICCHIMNKVVLELR